MEFATTGLDGSTTEQGAPPGPLRRELRLLPSHLSSTVKVVIIGVGALMALDQLTQARKNWYDGNVALESERLVRIQQEREQADIHVALSEAAKNLQEEMRAIAGREADIMGAIKHVQEGWGSALSQAAAANMTRYKLHYATLQRRIGECLQSKQCSQSELARLGAEKNVYVMLFYSARGSLHNALDDKRGKVLVPPSEEID